MSHQNSFLAPSTLLNVADSSGVGEVRRFAQAAAEDLGFDETRTGKVAIVATELANNLVRHAGGGMILARVSSKKGEPGAIDLLSLDRGPGMKDVARCMEDGYSTLAGGAGTGLGAIRRLSDTFDIYSVPGAGSAVLSRFGTLMHDESRIEIGALSLPYPGETVCGDAWQFDETPMTCCIAVIDGLGHGSEAGAAAREAVRTVEAHCRRPVEQVLELAHHALKPTRGAAMAMAEISLDSGHIAYAGVGNIVGATASADTLRRMVSYDGTVGHEIWKIRGFEYSLEPGQVLIMHSDGLRSQWRLDQYPGLLARDPFLIAGLLSFDVQDQTRIATAVSEIVRNAFEYAGGGRVEFLLQEFPSFLLVRVSDRGPGIHNLKEILSGRYVSRTGMGLGILGARRLMDRFEMDNRPEGGTVVVLGKAIPASAGELTPGRISEITEALARQVPDDPFQEVQRQNQELMRALEELRAREQELSQLNSELEDTNRGVVALYAELDEKADYLRRAYDVKSKFLSNMSHEFRTPLNSILSLSRLLLDRIDGDLTPEQEKQVGFIRKSADTLSELVNDLLDLAKVEAGKLVVRPNEFTAASLFSGLRGMLRPLLAQNSSINLVFDDVSALPALHTDEGKVSQILRNFISNALKYTEHGEVRVSASLSSEGRILFSVGDQGIGIAPENLQRIFEEFHQIEGPLQKKHKGTGLGLPLSKKLAELLGGIVRVTSRVGVGSTFSVEIPTVYGGPQEVLLFEELTSRPDFSRIPVLFVEDNRETLFIYEKYLKGSGFQPIPARTLADARRALVSFRPAAIVLDLLLEYENAWGFLEDLKSNPRTRGIPVIVATTIDNEKKALSLGADYFALKPVDREWLLAHLKEATRGYRREKALIVDDDAASRYVLRSLLGDTRYSVIEAESGTDGLRLAAEEKPEIIFLDLGMPDLSGEEVLDRLAADRATSGIPVIVNTSKVLSAADRERLVPRVTAILSKDRSSHEAALGALRQALKAAGAALLHSREQADARLKDV